MNRDETAIWASSVTYEGSVRFGSDWFSSVQPEGMGHKFPYGQRLRNR